jgi:hypothetical protein
LREIDEEVSWTLAMIFSNSLVSKSEGSWMIVKDEKLKA